MPGLAFAKPVERSCRVLRFVIAYAQTDSGSTPLTQVRQHTHHKRTFMFLEQLILKHGVDDSCTNVKDIHEGVDFFFANRQHAIKFIDFLQNVVPIRCSAPLAAMLHLKQVSDHMGACTWG